MTYSRSHIISSAEIGKGVMEQINTNFLTITYSRSEIRQQLSNSVYEVG